MFKTSLLLTLKDKLTAPVKKIKKSFDEVAKAASLKGRLRLLSRNMRKVRQDFQQLRKESKKLFKRIGILGGVAGGTAASLFALARGVASKGDSIAKTSRKLGLSVEELQQWRFAADRSGIAANTFDMALQRFTRRAREAADGTGEARGALKFLGVELKDSEGNLRDRTALLDDVADAMSKIEDPALRVRVAFKLFDSEGVNMVNLLAEGSKGMKALRKEASDLGVITEANAKSSESYIDALTNFTQVVTSLKDAVIGDLLPGMTEWLNTQTELIKAGKENFLQQLIQGIRTTVKNLSTFISNVNAVIQFLGGWKLVLSAVATLLGVKFLASLLSTALAISNLAKVVIPTLIAGLKVLWGVLLANPIVLVVAAIAAAAFMIIKNWEPIKGFFMGLWSDIKAMFKDGILNGIVRLILAFNPVVLFAKGFDALLQYFAGISLADAGTMLMDSLRGGIESAWFGVLGWFRDQLKGFISLIPTPLLNRLGLGGLNANITNTTEQTVSVPAVPTQKVAAEVGGVLHIQMDSEGRPKVKKIEKRGGMDLSAATGVMMQGAG